MSNNFTFCSYKYLEKQHNRNKWLATSLTVKLLKRKNWQLGWGGCGGEGGAYWGEEGSVFLLLSAEAGGGNHVYIKVIELIFQKIQIIFIQIANCIFQSPSSFSYRRGRRGNNVCSDRNGLPNNQHR